MNEEIFHQHSNALNFLMDDAFCIVLNANDFFYSSCADAVNLDVADLEWVLPIVEEFKYDGIGAVMSYIRDTMPLKSFVTPKFLEALKKLNRLAPVVWSREYLEGNTDDKI